MTGAIFLGFLVAIMALLLLASFTGDLPGWLLRRSDGGKTKGDSAC